MTNLMVLDGLLEMAGIRKDSLKYYPEITQLIEDIKDYDNYKRNRVIISKGSGAVVYNYVDYTTGGNGR